MAGLQAHLRCAGGDECPCNTSLSGVGAIELLWVVVGSGEAMDLMDRCWGWGWRRQSISEGVRTRSTEQNRSITNLIYHNVLPSMCDRCHRQRLPALPGAGRTISLEDIPSEVL